MNKSAFFLIILFVINSLTLRAQYTFVPNVGQWEEHFEYKTDFNGGAMFFTKNEIYTSLLSLDDMNKLHKSSLHIDSLKAKGIFEKEPSTNISGHAFKVTFIGSQTKAISGYDKQQTYNNYFLGNDKSKWKGHVSLFNGIIYKEIYKGIDLKYFNDAQKLKYEFKVSPDANTNDIQFRYEGVETFLDVQGNLNIRTSIGTPKELAPYSYQIINGRKVTVASRFILKDNVLSFSFPKGYNQNYELIIDPVLVFKSYSGTTAYTTGFASTYDNNGRLCINGKCLAAGFPATLGAFQTQYGGAVGNPTIAVDVVISLFNDNGSSRIYATYLGGNNADAPSTMIFNNLNQLVITGNTGSNNFPTTPGCYDATYGGGFGDAFVAVFSADGSQLVGSTYIGGTDEEGIDDIDIDNDNNLIIGGSTNSANLTVPGTAYQTVQNQNDVLLLKMNMACTQVLAGTFLGAPNGFVGGIPIGLDALSDLHVDPATNDILLFGFTNSPNFPTTAGAYSITGSNTGGGFISRLNSNMSQLLASTCYESPIDFGDMNPATGDIYACGKIDDAFPFTVSPNVYSNAQGKNFLIRVSPNLSSISLATRIGGEHIGSPVSFKRTGCGQFVIVQGFAIPNNPPYSASSADIGPNPLYTVGSYYLEVIEPEFAAFTYGTFFGMEPDLNLGSDHNHGGIRRIRNNGTVYMGTCTDNQTWWGTPGAYQPVNATGTFDMAGLVIKLDDITGGASDGFTFQPKDTICLGDTIFFHSGASPQANIDWNFGDNTTAHIPSPSHIYTAPGIYKVYYNVIDSTACVINDLDSATIYVFKGDDITIHPEEETVCKDEPPIVVKVTGGQTYQWTPADAVSDSTASQVTLKANGEYNLTVKITDKVGCITTKSVHVAQFNVNADAGPDRVIHYGSKTILDGSHSEGSSIFWDANTTLNSVNSLTPIATPPVTQWYYINAKDGTCEARDSVKVTVAGFGIPNSFSPNGDGLNDIFGIINNDSTNVNAVLSVYNRFGQRVFYSSKITKGWDGTFLGKPCDMGTYFFETTIRIGKEEFYFKGDLTLIR